MLHEQNVLSCILKKPQLIYEVKTKINDDYFYNDNNQIIFKVIDYLSKKQDIDKLELDAMTIYTVASKFKEVIHVLNDYFDNANEFIKYIQLLRELDTSPSNVDLHIDELIKINVINDLQDKNEEFSNTLISHHSELDTFDILNQAETNVLEITNKYSGIDDYEPELIGEGMMDDYLNRRVNKTGFVGYPTPFRQLNTFTNGILRKGNVVIVNAQTGVGKSTIIKNVVKYIGIDLGKPILWGANEEDKKDQRDKLLAEVSGISYDIIAKGLFNEPGNEKIREKVINGIKQIEQSQIFIDQIRGYTPELLIQRAKYFKNRYNIVGFAWDYVKRSTAFYGSDKQLRHWLGDVVNVMKEEIADPLDIFVLSASQAKTYEFLMAAESQDIERHSTNFVVLKKLSSKEQKENAYGADYGLVVKKNRLGSTHPNPNIDYIPLTLNKSTLCFSEAI